MPNTIRGVIDSAKVERDLWARCKKRLAARFLFSAFRDLTGIAFGEADPPFNFFKTSYA
jgi:hypothetical protein